MTQCQQSVNKMDQIEAVRALLATAEEQSFTSAAQRLGLSKALVSKRIAALEDRLGSRLLNRSTRSISLTEFGEHFVHKARSTLTDWDDMMETATSDGKAPVGTLRVAGPKAFGEAVLVDILADFLAAQPALRLELSLEERNVDIIREGFDLSIRVGEPEDSQLIGVALTPYPYVFCATPAYLEEYGRPQHPEELLHHDCIANQYLAQDGQWQFAKDGTRLKLRPAVRIVTSTDAVVRKFVRAGLGIGHCMRGPVEAELASGELQSVLDDWNIYNRKVYALYPHRSLLPIKTRLLLDHLKAHFAGAMKQQT